MRRTQSGITLLELMMVVAVVGILAAIAYPSYRDQVIRSKRADAKVALQQAAQGLENCFTRYHKYNHADCAVAGLLTAPGIESSDHNYKVTGAFADDLSFVITATAQNGQASDAGCATFTLDQNNARGSTGTKSVAECWK